MNTTWTSRTYISLLLISICTLCLEVLHIRIFGYATAPVLSYCAISFAMLGFAGGTAVLSIFPGILKAGTDRTLFILSVLFSLSLFLSGFMLTLFPLFNGPSRLPELNAGIVVSLLPSLLPYLLASLMIAIIFATHPSISGKMYFLNLLGSSIGCLIPMMLIRSVGAEILLAATGIGGLAVSLLLSSWMRKGARAAWVGASVLSAILLVCFSRQIFDFKPDPKDVISIVKRDLEARGMPLPTVEMTRWDPVGRIEVYRFPDSTIRIPEETDYRIVMVDSGASTIMMKEPRSDGTWGRELFEETLYGIGYRVSRPNPDVMVIGMGGGTDVQTALHWKARSITGVEINLTTLRAATGPYRSFLGLPAAGKMLEAIHADGRNFAKNTRKRFDIVQLSGVDTFTLNSPGGLVLVENYLYTVEAFTDFLKILKPGGTLVVLRFDAEGIKLGVIAYHALDALGAKDPTRNIVVLKQSRLEGVLVKNTPFTDEDIKSIEKATSRREPTGIFIRHYDFRSFKLSLPIQAIFMPGQTSSDAIRARIASVMVPTDDRPYYMVSEWFRPGEVHQSLKIIRSTWFIIVALSFIFLFLPLLSRSKVYPLRISSLLMLLFFFSIAVGYMFVEIGLIQKTIVFIGYPGGSASLVLASLLMGSGLGSYLSGRTRIHPMRLMLLAAPVVILVIFAYIAMGKPMLELMAAQGAVVRWLGCCLIVMILGLPMGILFPSALRLTGERHEPLVPWAISVNGFAGAAASVIAFPIAIFGGLKLLIFTGAAGYLLAMAAAGLYALRERPWKAS